MKVFLLGAGASRAALGADAPVSREFGQVLSAKVPRWQERFPFLWSAIRYLCGQDRSITEGDWALDRVWNGIDENYKLRDFIENSDLEWPETVPPRRIYSVYQLQNWRAFWVLAGWEMKRALNEIYGIQLEDAISRYVREPGGLAMQLWGLDASDVVASTNYDLLAERVASQKWSLASNYRNEADAGIRSADHGPMILKLHGSLDWDFMSNRHVGARVERTRTGGPMADSSIDYDGDEWEHRPLVVAPVRFKDEVLVPGMQPPILVETLAFQWVRFLDALSRMDEFFVLGYRFPLDDIYGNRMVQEAMRRRRHARGLRTNLYLKEDCLEVRNRLRQLLPTASPIECLGPLEN